MAQRIERRRCKRFEIPGAEGRYKKTGLLSLFKGFSRPYRVVNISKGGLALACEEKFRPNDEVIIRLIVPNETPLNLRARVRWQGRPVGRMDTIVGVEFKPFGSPRGSNSLEALDVLTRLEARYTRGDNERTLAARLRL
jgi:hypothetical protein